MTPNEVTSPAEREFLTALFTRGTAEGLMIADPAKREYVDRFAAAGLLAEDHGGRILPNDDALKAYMAALAAVQLPVLRWIVPEPPP